MAIAEPIYFVEHKLGAFEIRNYSPYLVAEVSVSGTRDAAINKGFRILASYIFGENHNKSKIAMTAPVSQTENTRQKIAMTAPVS
ncbi:MAG: heme-binding protein [Caulobacterales bacterium]|nr:heme-binding protein [Caulobacterales bacterium]